MKTIELWFGKWDSPSIFFNILSIEFEIVPKITSLNELECFICCHGDFNVQIRYADEPFGYCQDLCAKKNAGSGRMRSASSRDVFQSRL